MNDLIPFTSAKRDIVNVNLSNIVIPGEGLLLDIYNLFLAIDFNSHSQQKYEQLLAPQNNQDILKFINPVYLVIYQEKHIIFCGFRFFHIAKSLNLKYISALIFDSNFSANDIHRLSLLHLLQTVLLADTSLSKINKAIKEISGYIKSNKNKELINLIYSDTSIKDVLRLPNYLYRSPSIKKNSKLEDRIEAAKEAVDLEFRSYD